MVCPGSVPLSEGIVEPPSRYADEGTAAHALAAHCLENNKAVADLKGAFIYLMENGETGEHYETFGFDTKPLAPADKILNEFEVDDDMVNAVGDYVYTARELRDAVEGDLHVEQRLSIAYMTGEEEAQGTSDVVIASNKVLIVVDLKYGMGVRVDAEDNRQLKMYAASAKRKYELLYDFDKVTVMIHQPRLNHISEHTYTLQEIEDFEAEVRVASLNVKAAIQLHEDGGEIDDFLTPSEDACRWCKAKANCPSLAKFITEAIDADFEDLSGVDDAAYYNSVKVEVYNPEELSLKAKSIELIEMWCKAVRGKVKSLLLEGKAIPGFKLVEGKMGHRKWADEQEAETVFKSMRLKVEEMYDMKLISPTSAEKVLKESPKRWARIKPLITQTKGSPSVAPESDKRPAMVITQAGDEMDDLTKEEDLIG